MKRPICAFKPCGRRSIYSVIPMTGEPGRDVWSDNGPPPDPTPSCPNHLTSTITWMSEYERDFHVRLLE